MGNNTKSVRISDENYNRMYDEAATNPQVDEKDPFYTIEMQDPNANGRAPDQNKHQEQIHPLRFPPIKLQDDARWTYSDDYGVDNDDDDDDDANYGITGKQQAHVEDDDDEEFDWNDDPDAPEKPKRRKTTKERIQDAMKKPCCWHFLSPFVKRMIIAVLGSIIFITIGLCMYFLMPKITDDEADDSDNAMIRSNVQIWMYWAAFMWHIGWLTSMFVEIIPTFVSLWTKIFVGRRSEKVNSSMEYYMPMKKYITILLLAAWSFASWAFLCIPFPAVQKQGYSAVIWKVFASIFVTACFLFIEKSIIQIIATRFHRSAYSERIAQNKLSLKVLDSLSKSEARRSRSESNNNLHQRYISSDSTPGLDSTISNTSTINVLPNVTSEPISYVNSHSSQPNSARQSWGNPAERFTNLHKRVQGMIMTDKPQALSRIDTRKVDINSNDFAKKVAKKLFYSLAYPFGVPLPPPPMMTTATGSTESNIGSNGIKTLEKYHFRPYFKTDEQCSAAFGVFDRDGNGDVTRREFRDTVIDIYRERKLLAQCIRDTSQALGSVDIILFILFMILSLFLCITTVFGVNLYDALIPLGTFVMGVAFTFSNTAKVAFESILFLFVTHPYDVGDLVYIDGDPLSVHNMGITGTVFIRGDGQKIYAPTTVLMTKLITNVRRSGNMGESISLNVDFRTSTDLVFALRERLMAWIKDQPREYADGFDVRLEQIVDVNKLVLAIWLSHLGNWQDMGKRLQRRNRFMFMLKDTLDELKIHYELPAQRFTSNSEFFDNTNKIATQTAQSFATTMPGPASSPSALPHNVRMYGYTQSTSDEADGVA